jgi:antitoxin HicB
MSPIRYSIVIQWSDEGDAFVVSLPEWRESVHTHGETYEEALARGKDLLEGLIEVRHQAGEPLPQPRVFVSV